MELLNLFEDFSDDKRSIEILENALLEANSVEEDENKVIVEKKIITLINKKLETSETFGQGVNLINSLSSEISKDSFIKYYPNWYTKFMNSLNNTKSQNLQSVCQTFGILIKRCKQIHELDKTVSAFHIKQIVEAIYKRFLQEKNENLLNLLIVALYYYPQSCLACMGPLRTTENFSEIILSCINENSKGLINSGAKCYSLLVRALERTFIQSAKDNINKFENGSAKCHALHQMDLCHNLNLIMSELFQDLVTSSKDSSFDHQSSSDKILRLPDLPDLSSGSLLENYIKAENRFTNVSNYLCSLLKIGTSTGQKFVQPQVILQIIHRGLSISPNNFGKTNESKKSIMLYTLPKLHNALLNILEALIECFGRELLQYGLTIQRLILQTLIWTKSFSQKAVINLRIHAYKVLSLWMQKMRFLSGFHLVANEFLSHIELDLSSNKEILTLKQKPLKNSSKADKKKSKEILNIKQSQENSLNLNSIMLQSQVLSTIESIISSASHQLNPSFYDTIKNIVTKLQYEQNVNKGTSKINKNSVEYNSQLIRTSTILQTFTHHSTGSLAPYAIKNFNMIISQDNNIKNTKEAYIGLANLSHIVYPAAPTLLPSTSLQTIQPTESNSLELNENLFSSQKSKRVNENGSCIESELIKRQKTID